MEGKILSIVLLLSMFATGYFFGYRNGLRHAWEKVVRHLKSKMSDKEAAKVFMEIINTK